jgi:transmembrane sensor
MSNVVDISLANSRQKLAVEWLVKFERSLSSEEKVELYQWFDESQANLDSFLKVAELWDKMGTLARLSELFPLSHKESYRKRNVWQLSLVAAIAFVCLTVTSFYFTQDDLKAPPLVADLSAVRVKGEQSSLTTVYETAIGEQSHVILADGSSIILNTNSLLSVRLGRHQRILSLERGEVHVDVAHDPKRPLSVVAGDSIVQAVGTTFAVEINDNKSIEVIVTEGKVLVGKRPVSNASNVRTITSVLPFFSLTVAEGESIQLGNAGAEVHAVSAEDIDDQLSWREGNLIFRDETLESAMAEIGRYTTIEFVFVDESLKQEVIAGRFKAGDVEGLLAVLRENIGIAYERTEDGRVLLSHM